MGKASASASEMVLELELESVSVWLSGFRWAHRRTVHIAVGIPPARCSIRSLCHTIRTRSSIRCLCIFGCRLQGRSDRLLDGGIAGAWMDLVSWHSFGAIGGKRRLSTLAARAIRESPGEWLQRLLRSLEPPPGKGGCSAWYPAQRTLLKLRRRIFCLLTKTQWSIRNLWGT